MIKINKVTKQNKKRDIRTTIILDEAQWELMKAFACWKRVTIKYTLSQAIADFLKKHKKSIQEAKAVYHRTQGRLNINFTKTSLHCVLADGREISAPLAWFPKLRDATDLQRNEWHVIGNGIGIHWPTLDEDISISQLLSPQIRKERS